MRSARWLGMALPTISASGPQTGEQDLQPLCRWSRVGRGNRHREDHSQQAILRHSYLPSSARRDHGKLLLSSFELPCVAGNWIGHFAAEHLSRGDCKSSKIVWSQTPKRCFCRQNTFDLATKHVVVGFELNALDQVWRACAARLEQVSRKVLPRLRPKSTVRPPRPVGV